MARKKSTKKAISPVRQEYNRERNRIQRQINRMHQRGYMGMEDMLPSIPKRITKASVRRLKKITTKDLYDKADFVDLTTGEVIATGRQGRAIERKRAAEKGRRTRARKKAQYSPVLEQQEQPGEDREEPVQEEDFSQEVQDAIERTREAMEEQWQRQRAQRDAEDRQRMQDEEYAKQFGKGELMRQHIQDVLDGMRADFPGTVADIERLLEDAESTQGEALWERLADQPEILEALEQTFYHAGDHISPTAFNRFKSAVLQRAMTAREARESQEQYERDQDLAFDFDPDEEW